MKYGRHQIDKAGDILISSKNTEEVSTYSIFDDFVFTIPVTIIA